MKGQRILVSTLALGLLLALAGGLSQAQEPEPQGSTRPLAAVGSAFTYQGRLNDGTSPANGNYDFEFRLYDAANGGSQVGSDPQGDVTVTDGFFAVVVDFGSSAFDGNARWLEIGVRPGNSTGAYTTLAPRQALTAVPYAQSAPWSGLSGVPTGWALTGNSGTTPGTHFLGTADGQALELRVNNARVLRLEPNTTSPNVIGGYSGNSVTGGVAGATIGGGGDSGSPNQVTAGFGTIGGGHGNTASSDDATVGGGSSNTAGGDQATVCGGSSNTASGYQDAVCGGSGNTASGDMSTVGGGYGNTAGSYYATVGGGNANTANGHAATVPGGASNTAGGAYSFAAGHQAKANSQGCFVWGDSTGADVTCNDDDRWVARASGGVYFYTNDSLTSGAYLPAGASAWAIISDRNLKENVAPVDAQAILARLVEIPLTTWNYKSQAPTIRHIGPMAQDFYAAFGLGESDQHISTIDADGVALAAIQGLYELAQEQAGHIQALEAENAALQGRLDSLEARLAALEQVVTSEEERR